MPGPNWPNRTLFHGDNLEVMRAMNSGTVDLIATDPPFNKSKDFHATPDSLAEGASFHDRWSWETDVEEEWKDQIKDDHPALGEVIEGAMAAHSKGMAAYICYMAIRLLEMKRILKESGSIFLHCDSTASHYLKAMMDAIFGPSNFFSDIVWKRYAAHSLARSGVDTITDNLLYYSKQATAVSWPAVTRALTKEEVVKRFPHVETETGRRYQHVALEQSSNKSSAGQERVIQGRAVTSHVGWRWTQETFDKRLKENPNLIYWTREGRPRYKLYADEYGGMPVGNIWTDIPYLSSGDSERTGYPTQKPLALYERIIAACSKPGQIVLDPFCGCATTCIAAENLGRQWVGIDIWTEAHEVVLSRFTKRGHTVNNGPVETRQAAVIATMFDFGEVHYVTTVPLRTDKGEIGNVPHLKVKAVTYNDAEDRKWNRGKCLEELLDPESRYFRGLFCQGCGREFAKLSDGSIDVRLIQVDHINPRAAGGENHVRNRALLCAPCNSVKSDGLTLPGLRKHNRKMGYMINDLWDKRGARQIRYR